VVKTARVFSKEFIKKSISGMMTARVDSHFRCIQT
jgi:hypothetical protein